MKRHFITGKTLYRRMAIKASIYANNGQETTANKYLSVLNTLANVSNDVPLQQSINKTISRINAKLA